MDIYRIALCHLVKLSYPFPYHLEHKVINYLLSASRLRYSSIQNRRRKCASNRIVIPELEHTLLFSTYRALIFPLPLNSLQCCVLF